MTNFLNDTRLQGIMVVLFIKTNIQSKMMNSTMIPCGRISLRKLTIIQLIHLIMTKTIQHTNHGYELIPCNNLILQYEFFYNFNPKGCT